MSHTYINSPTNNLLAPTFKNVNTLVPKLSGREDHIMDPSYINSTDVNFFIFNQFFTSDLRNRHRLIYIYKFNRIYILLSSTINKVRVIVVLVRVLV